MDRVPIENAWRRGWSDTMTDVASPQFKLGETLVALLMATATGLLTGPVFGGWQGSLVALGAGAGAAVGALLGFAVLLLWNCFRAPIRQRNEARARQEQREQLRPEIGTELEARDNHNEGTQHHLLKVTNDSGVTISRYYARFLEFRDPHNHAINDLMDYDLCWHKAGRESREKKTSIPSETSRYIHLFTTIGTHNHIAIPQVVDGTYRSWNMTLNPVPAGTYYTAILEIGSDSDQVHVPPVDVELRISYQGNHDLSAAIRVAPHIDIGLPEPGSDTSYTESPWFVV